MTNKSHPQKESIIITGKLENQTFSKMPNIRWQKVAKLTFSLAAFGMNAKRSIANIKCIKNSYVIKCIRVIQFLYLDKLYLQYKINILIGNTDIKNQTVKQQFLNKCQTINHILLLIISLTILQYMQCQSIKYNDLGGNMQY